MHTLQTPASKLKKATEESDNDDLKNTDKGGLDKENSTF
jgi:hypothetical protein